MNTTETNLACKTMLVVYVLFPIIQQYQSLNNAISKYQLSFSTQYWLWQFYMTNATKRLHRHLSVTTPHYPGHYSGKAFLKIVLSITFYGIHNRIKCASMCTLHKAKNFHDIIKHFFFYMLQGFFSDKCHPTFQGILVKFEGYKKINDNTYLIYKYNTGLQLQCLKQRQSPQ